jgi:hypothetical protein
MSRMQIEAKEMKSSSTLMILDYGATGVTSFSLVMLLIQLGYAGEAYRHICTSRILLERGIGQLRKQGSS